MVWLNDDRLENGRLRYTDWQEPETKKTEYMRLPSTPNQLLALLEKP